MFQKGRHVKTGGQDGMVDVFGVFFEAVHIHLIIIFGAQGEAPEAARIGGNRCRVYFDRRIQIPDVADGLVHDGAVKQRGLALAHHQSVFF